VRLRRRVRLKLTSPAYDQMRATAAPSSASRRAPSSASSASRRAPSASASRHAPHSASRRSATRLGATSAARLAAQRLGDGPAAEPVLARLPPPQAGVDAARAFKPADDVVSRTAASQFSDFVVLMINEARERVWPTEAALWDALMAEFLDGVTGTATQAQRDADNDVLSGRVRAFIAAYAKWTRQIQRRDDGLFTVLERDGDVLAKRLGAAARFRALPLSVRDSIWKYLIALDNVASVMRLHDAAPPAVLDNLFRSGAEALSSYKAARVTDIGSLLGFLKTLNPMAMVTTAMETVPPDDLEAFRVNLRRAGGMRAFASLLAIAAPNMGSLLRGGGGGFSGAAVALGVPASAMSSMPAPSDVAAAADADADAVAAEQERVVQESAQQLAGSIMAGAADGGMPRVDPQAAMSSWMDASAAAQREAWVEEFIQSTEQEDGIDEEDEEEEEGDAVVDDVDELSADAIDALILEAAAEAEGGIGAPQA